MDTRMLNALAALLRGDQNEKEKTESLELLGQSSEAREIYLLADCPGVSELATADFPFSTKASFVAGVAEGFFRLYDTIGVRLTGRMGNLARSIQQISAESLPVCLKRKGEIECHLAPDQPLTRMTFEQNQGAISLTLLPEQTGQGYLELWKSNELVRAIPLATASKRTLSGLELNTPYAIRIGSASEGLAIVFVATEFGRGEWTSACLWNALSGDLFEAIRILKNEMIQFSAPETFHLHRLGCLLQSLSQIAKVDVGTLSPQPVVRSRHRSKENLKDLYQVVWNGISFCWPSVVEIPNPWETEQSNPENAGATLPQEVRELATATIQAAESGFQSDAIKIQGNDPQVRDGWTSLLGWTCLSNRDYNQAFEVFSSIVTKQSDPFGALPARMIAKNFARSGDTPPREGEPGFPADVWGSVFEPILREPT